VVGKISKRNQDDWICFTTPVEQNFGDFTLYFLAFDRSGVELTDKEKKETCLAREGANFIIFNP